MKNTNFKIAKVYPIEGRKDFFKYTIQLNGILAKDYKGNEMHFDDLNHAKSVCNAKNKVNRINKDFLNT